MYFLPPALEGAVEALEWSSRIAVERPLPQITLLGDYFQPLERYDDYEEDNLGELRAQSTLTQTFGIHTPVVTST